MKNLWLSEINILANFSLSHNSKAEKKISLKTEDKKIRKKSLKAQIIGQVFIFIFAISVFAFLIGFGYKYILQLQSAQYSLSVIDFKDKLIQNIENIRYRTGSVEKLILNVPLKHNEVCFVDSSNTKELAINRPLMHLLWAGSRQNVFLQPLSQIEIKIPDIEIAQGYCCLDSKGNIILRLEALPNKVKLDPWDDECII